MVSGFPLRCACRCKMVQQAPLLVVIRILLFILVGKSPVLRFQTPRNVSIARCWHIAHTHERGLGGPIVCFGSVGLLLGGSAFLDLPAGSRTRRRT